jgi:predicted acetyltransferase
MEIRGVRESELAEMIELQCRVFRPDGHERFWQYVRGDSSYSLGQNRVVVVNGRIAAMLRVWKRQMRLGSGIVHMGGIGGVCTHPDHRGAGYATALMKEVVAYMRRAGYDLSVLFSIIPGQFYRRLGWASFPLAAFRISAGRTVELWKTNWQIESFDEARDLAQVVALYEVCNARQSGSIVRSNSYWDSAPARIRHILPSVVARRGQRLGGYLNYEIAGKNARVLEVAYLEDEPAALAALANHLLQVCEKHNIETIEGEMPHRHPLIALLVEGSAGDLYLAGHTSMMLYAINLPGIFRQLLPDLQTRLDATERKFPPLSIGFTVNDQQCALRLDNSGMLELAEAGSPAEQLNLPGEFFWRILLGETSWAQLEPAAQARGVAVRPEVSALLALLFPQQEVIFWMPDHY